jgi:hypothetical protein
MNRVMVSAGDRGWQPLGSSGVTEVENLIWQAQIQDLGALTP